MRQLLTTIFLSSIFMGVSFSQNNIISEMQSSLENFDYRNVISLAEYSLKNKESLSTDDLKNIYKLAGIAYYSISQNDSSQISFRSLLMLDKNYELDSSQVSPKVISFFEVVKRNYLTENNKTETSTAAPVDSAALKKIHELELQQNNLRWAFPRSVLLPGWGHLYLGNTTKGTLLLSAGILSLGFSIYYIFNTQNKEKKYLSATDQLQIAQTYSSYNTSYKIRNGLLISYAVIWLYTQFDLLFSSDSSQETIYLNSSYHRFMPDIKLNSDLIYYGISYTFNF